MKKSESIIRSLKLKEVRSGFKQLRKDLFFDRYVTTVRHDESENQQIIQQVVYINQNTGRQYSFPGISYREK